jgi:hypothetical protein
VFACGNVLQVHDLVDNVSEEAAIAGSAAAAYVKGEGAFSGDVISVEPQMGTSYVVPQRIRKGENQPIDLYFRVRDFYKPARVEVVSEDKVLLSRKKQIMTPGEMEKITLSAEKLAQAGDTIAVRVIGG